MFGFFQPTCPVGLEEKVWIEREMRRLAGLFGARRFREAKPILPGELARYGGDHEALFQFIRNRLNCHTDFDLLPLKAESFDQLVARFVRCCCDAILSEHWSSMSGGASSLLAIDVLGIMLGAAVPLANACLESHQWRDGNVAFRMRWRRYGMLPAHLYGYGIAVWCWDRGDVGLDLRRELRPDAREPFDKSLRYLNVTADSVFWDRPQHMTLTIAEEGLSDRSLSVVLDTLWDLGDSNETYPALSERVGELIQHRDTTIVWYALYLVSRHIELARENINIIGDLTVSDVAKLRRGAINVLAALAPCSQRFVPSVLTRLERDPDRDVQVASIHFLSHFAELGNEVVAPVLHFAYETVRQDNTHLGVVIAALLRLGLTPKEIRDELHPQATDRSTVLLINQCLETDLTE